MPPSLPPQARINLLVPHELDSQKNQAQGSVPLKMSVCACWFRKPVWTQLSGKKYSTLFPQNESIRERHISHLSKPQS